MGIVKKAYLFDKKKSRRCPGEVVDQVTYGDTLLEREAQANE